jgi:hypothetical protein
MNNLVERLREEQDAYELCHEAADEIERQRKELDFLHTELDKLRRLMDEPP